MTKRRNQAYYGRLENVAAHLVQRTLGTPTGDEIWGQLVNLTITIERNTQKMLEALRKVEGEQRIDLGDMPKGN